MVEVFSSFLKNYGESKVDNEVIWINICKEIECW